MNNVAHTSDPAVLAIMLEDARARTLGLWRDIRDEWLLGPKISIVNPPLWEIGHVGWFQEHWCLRYRGPSDKTQSLMPNADALYDSATVPHATRWTLPVPDLDATLDYLERVLELTVERVELEGDREDLRYFVQLAAFHEQMHCEAFTYTRQTLGYSAPPNAANLEEIGAGERTGGDASIPGGRFLLGAEPGTGFVFDNEKWAHEVAVAPFAMGCTAVTYAELLAFVEAGGYSRRELWSEAGWIWRESAGATQPLYWFEQDGEWWLRRFDRYVPLPLDAAVIHVNWFEADAWCRWTGRRLPTEAEWELAAATMPGNLEHKRRYPWGDEPPEPELANLAGTFPWTCDAHRFPEGDSGWGVRQMLGNVWEWTSDVFRPYPGFVVDPYAEYSVPWFGDHMVLRGGCYATNPGLIRNTWRNFYTPDRRDVLAGFRTCAR